MSDALTRLDPLYRQAESGQTPFQYQEAIRILGELSAQWDSAASGVIADDEILDAYNALNGAVHDGLPGGSAFGPYLATLQSGDKDAAKKFVRDLGRILTLLGEFKGVVRAQVLLLQGPAPRTRRYVNARRAVGG